MRVCVLPFHSLFISFPLLHLSFFFFKLCDRSPRLCSAFGHCIVGPHVVLFAQTMR